MFYGPRTSNHSTHRLSLRYGAYLALLGSALLAFGQSAIPGTHFSAIMPLGSDSILLKPANQRLNMLLSVECPEMERIVAKGDGHNRTVTDLDGKPVLYYPHEISFRFTIGSRTASDEVEPNEVDSKDTIDHFQSSLHFRLKVFHGTKATTYEPAELKMLGVPADIPFDERIYHFTFKLKNIPVEDRMMLEILDEQGNRVGKFHLQLL